MTNLLRATGWTALIVAIAAAYAISPVGFAATVLILGSAAALTPNVREPLRQGWPGWKPSPATIARAERASRAVRDTARPLTACAVDALRDPARRRGWPKAARPVHRPEPAAVQPVNTAGARTERRRSPHRQVVDPDTIIRQSGEVAELRLQVVREQIAADTEQALAASADEQQRQVHLDKLYAHRTAAAALLDRIHQLELDLTGLRAEPPACPDCGAWLGWHPSQCATCATVAAQSPPPAINTHPGHPDPAETPMTLNDFVTGPIPTPEEDPYQADDGPPALGDVVTVELTDSTFATGTVTRSGPGRSFRFVDSDGVEGLAHASDIRPTPPPRTPTLKEATPVSTTTTNGSTSMTGSSDGAGLGTAGRASIQGLIVDWESSVEARQHPETFVAWLQAQAAAARQRAQMVPELVASYHGRGPSGHAGVPDSQITAFSAAYEESAMAEAEAYGRWAIEYAAYVEAAEEEMVSTYGREVIGSAHAAHNG